MTLMLAGPVHRRTRVIFLLGLFLGQQIVTAAGTILLPEGWGFLVCMAATIATVILGSVYLLNQTWAGHFGHRAFVLALVTTSTMTSIFIGITGRPFVMSWIGHPTEVRIHSERTIDMSRGSSEVYTLEDHLGARVGGEVRDLGTNLDVGDQLTVLVDPTGILAPAPPDPDVDTYSWLIGVGVALTVMLCMLIGWTRQPDIDPRSPGGENHRAAHRA